MSQWRSWPTRSKVLFGVLVLYAMLLFGSSSAVFFASIRSGWDLKRDDVCLEILMFLFLPMLVVGVFRPRMASILLAVGMTADLVLLLSLSNSTGDGVAGAVVGSTLFLGVPMLGSAWFLFRQERRINVM